MRWQQVDLSGMRWYWFLGLACVMGLVLSPPANAARSGRPDDTGVRYALVIGIDGYQKFGPLTMARGDARALVRPGAQLPYQTCHPTWRQKGERNAKSHVRGVDGSVRPRGVRAHSLGFLRCTWHVAGALHGNGPPERGDPREDGDRDGLHSCG